MGFKEKSERCSFFNQYDFIFIPATYEDKI